METTFLIKERPHFELAPKTLAAWLMDQGTDRWWSVDGDPFLSSLIAMPCPADELAELLERIDKPLLIHDPKERDTSRGQRIERWEELNGLCLRLRDNEKIEPSEGQPPWLENRFFALCWKNRNDAWLLIEDLETTADYASELESEKAR